MATMGETCVKAPLNPLFENNKWLYTNFEKE